MKDRPIKGRGILGGIISSLKKKRADRRVKKDILALKNREFVVEFKPDPRVSGENHYPKIALYGDTGDD
jgi:hypothetical protein